MEISKPRGAELPSATTRLSDLTGEQVLTLARLDDGFDPVDSVGRPEDDLQPWELSAALELLRLGLAERIEGHRGQAWFRLTDEGWWLAIS